jgi:Ca2+-binding EF-hand superfamily protein
VFVDTPYTKVASHAASDGGVASQGDRPSFEVMDTDANGSVTFDEFSTALSARGSGGPDPSQVFGMIDSDGSGELSQDEFANSPLGQ